jgi:hypothetical protein
MNDGESQSMAQVAIMLTAHDLPTILTLRWPPNTFSNKY